MVTMISLGHVVRFFFFFFNDTATTEIYTLSLHDALPICEVARELEVGRLGDVVGADHRRAGQAADRADDDIRPFLDRKSTRLNSSHGYISYAVFCLKKKTNNLDTLSPHFSMPVYSYLSTP